MADFLINPNIAKTLLLTSAGLIFTALPGAVNAGKVPSALSLTLATACFGGSMAFSRRWERDEASQGRLEIVEATIVDAQLSAQTMGAIEESKRQYLPHLYVEPARVQQRDDRALPAGNDEAAAIVPSSTVLEVRDLATEMGGYEGHFLVASRTRSGKTSLIQRAIGHSLTLRNGLVDFWIFDPKGAHWCGLEKNKDQYLFCNSKDLIPLVIERLTVLVGVLEDRQHQRVKLGGHWPTDQAPMPMIIAIDEYNTLRALANQFDAGYPPKENPKTAFKLKTLVERVIFQGGEDKVYLWLMAQTTRVGQLDLDTSVQDNCSYIALSRNGDYQSVEDAIGNNYVVSNAKERRELQAQLTTYRADKSQDLAIPMAFTTLGGNTLCKLPDARKSQTVSAPAPTQPSLSKEQIDSIASDILTEDLDPRARLERDWQAEAPVNIDPSEMNAEELNRLIEERRSPAKKTLSKPAQAILDKYQFKEMYGTWIDARWVKRSVFYTVELKHFSAIDIRAFFNELTLSGIGSTEGEGDTLRWYMELEADEL